VPHHSVGIVTGDGLGLTTDDWRACVGFQRKYRAEVPVADPYAFFTQHRDSAQFTMRWLHLEGLDKLTILRYLAWHEVDLGARAGADGMGGAVVGWGGVTDSPSSTPSTHWR
jgi:hypothetical protein